MPNTREKLIELIRMPIKIMQDAVVSPHITFTLPYAEDLADHLIANGVTILTEPECEKINIKLPKEIVVHPYKPKWIPVTERLPKYNTFVIVFAEGIVGEAVLDDANYWYWAGTDEDASEINVTHWMHLPEPPKGE